ncbi:PNPLA6 [Bugula neritina]|uniref:lysophospholipase n=1 Tax=Bugula neritina TaxID=10212 RepID=A0A7J7K634_BUGNE|nr:PNPLA6 [Bugula neritina]
MAETEQEESIMYILLTAVKIKMSQLVDRSMFYLEQFYTSENFQINILMVTLISSLIYVIMYFLFRQKKVSVISRPDTSRPRFRKRDKVKYYARKILRKSKQVVNQARKPRNKQEFMKLAKSLLRIRQRSNRLEHKDPPRALLTPDLGSSENDLRLPTEFIYLLRNVQVFGHLDQQVFFEINRTMEVKSYRANQTVFQIGNPDDCIYVVTSGLINVYIREANGDEVLVKEVFAGDSIYSLLSILDLLTGHEAPYKTVSARAMEDSTILKIPGQSFARAFETSPESMLRVVQVIMVRLIRVTFWALHNYLGLDQELMKRESPALDNLSPDGITTLESQDTPDGGLENDEKLTELCINDLASILKIEDKSMLVNKISICHYRANSVLCNQGDADADLTFVVQGQLVITQTSIDKGEKPCIMFNAGPGEIVGVLATLSGEPSIFGIKTNQPTIVGHISKSCFYGMMRQQPDIVLAAAHLLVKRLSPFVRQIDFALDWVQVESGRAIYNRGDMSDHLYIILNGRIRTIIEGKEGNKSVSGEFGKGELIGIAEVITRTKRSMTAMAVRDTELAQVPAQLLEHIRQVYPQIITRLYHLLGNRLMGMQMRIDEQSLKDNPSIVPRSPISNISTVAIVAASDGVPLTSFTLELQHALSSICHSLRLTSDIIKAKLGSWALDRPNEYRLSSWLAAQEDTHRTVIYQCDYQFTPWTQRCIRQSDVILIVALAEEQPKPGPLEKSLEGMSIRSQKELILLHRSDATKPQNTVDWLNARDWCLSHHHIRCPNRVFSKKSPEKILSAYENVIKGKPDVNSDMSRLARFLTGTAIGLVLGGAELEAPLRSVL